VHKQANTPGMINVPFSGFTDDFVPAFPARRKDVESKKEQILAYARAPR